MSDPISQVATNTTADGNAVPDAAPERTAREVAQEMIIALSLERQRLRDDLAAARRALRDLLAVWERRDESGWTAADAARLEEIRKLVGA